MQKNLIFIQLENSGTKVMVMYSLICSYKIKSCISCHIYSWYNLGTLLEARSKLNIATFKSDLSNNEGKKVNKALRRKKRYSSKFPNLKRKKFIYHIT